MLTFLAEVRSRAPAKTTTAVEVCGAAFVALSNSFTCNKWRWNTKHRLSRNQFKRSSQFWLWCDRLRRPWNVMQHRAISCSQLRLWCNYDVTATRNKHVHFSATLHEVAATQNAAIVINVVDQLRLLLLLSRVSVYKSIIYAHCLLLVITERKWSCKRKFSAVQPLQQHSSTTSTTWTQFRCTSNNGSSATAATKIKLGLHSISKVQCKLVCHIP